jgi:hypothetical protein
MEFKKSIYSTHSPWAPHTYDFAVLTSLTHPRKLILFVLQIGKAKNLSAPLRRHCYLQMGGYAWTKLFMPSKMQLTSKEVSNSIF